jgi:hypothetical protein
MAHEFWEGWAAWPDDVDPERIYAVTYAEFSSKSFYFECDCRNRGDWKPYLYRVTITPDEARFTGEFVAPSKYERETWGTVKGEIFVTNERIKLAGKWFEKVKRAKRPVLEFIAEFYRKQGRSAEELERLGKEAANAAATTQHPPVSS